MRDWYKIIQDAKKTLDSVNDCLDRGDQVMAENYTKLAELYITELTEWFVISEVK